MKYNTLRNGNGERIGAYQFVYDVTERILEQERLARAEEQLRHGQASHVMATSDPRKTPQGATTNQPTTTKGSQDERHRGGGARH